MFMPRYKCSTHNTFNVAAILFSWHPYLIMPYLRDLLRMVCCREEFAVEAILKYFVCTKIYLACTHVYLFNDEQRVKKHSTWFEDQDMWGTMNEIFNIEFLCTV